MSSTLVVHHLRVSQSETIVWLCEELGIEYELKCYDREPTMMAPDAYKAISPLKTSPVIEDIDSYTTNPEHIKLAESQACVEWICRKYGHGRLVNKPWDAHWKEWLFWWYFTHGSLQPAIQMKMITNALPKDHPLFNVADARIQHYLGLIDEQLGKSSFLVGDDFTAADLILIFPLTTMRTFIPIDLSAYTNILRYLKEIGERPAYQRAFEKAETKLKPMLDANPASPYSS